MGHVVSTKGFSDSDFDPESGTASDSRFENGRNFASMMKEESTGEECPICTEEILLRDLAKLDPCNHEFHQECINQWLEDHSTCPNCRQEVVQVVFNYKRCSLIAMESRRSEEEDEVSSSREEDDEDDDEEIIPRDPDDDAVDEEEGDSNESTIEFTHSLDDYESIVVSEHIIIGEEVVNADWADLEDLNDSHGESGPQRVNIKVADDDWIFFSFYSKCPEILMQSTDPELGWKIYHEGLHIVSVPPNGQLTLRGYFFLHLEDLVIEANGRLFPLKNDPEFQEFLKPSACFFDSQELAMARHERIQMFMDYLRNHLVA